MPKANSISVVIGDKSYPCRMTMGAMLRYHRETGNEVSDIKGSISEFATLLYCCTKSACLADHVDFGLTLDEFCDNIEASEIEGMLHVIQGEPSEGSGESGEKKSL